MFVGSPGRFLLTFIPSEEDRGAFESLKASVWVRERSDTYSAPGRVSTDTSFEGSAEVSVAFSVQPEVDCKTESPGGGAETSAGSTNKCQQL
jgi:hypothetical protein